MAIDPYPPPMDSPPLSCHGCVVGTAKARRRAHPNGELSGHESYSAYPQPYPAYGAPAYVQQPPVYVQPPVHAPPQSRSKSGEPTVFLSSTSEITPVKEMLSQPAQGSSLRVRLLTKGYRQNLVDVALARVPRERLQYVECYIKAMSILEMKGVEAEKTVKFLVDSNISNKQAVVQRAQMAEQLIGMGFTAEQVFLGLLTTQGDRVKALDMLLGTR
ncbi:hypothetical protein Q1695_008048 [Nippostrongylus brasiliensis]|nr:hypothetical protein Q1695_008048 [Nippostrongylus brasiliensis]